MMSETATPTSPPKFFQDETLSRCCLTVKIQEIIDLCKSNHKNLKKIPGRDAQQKRGAQALEANTQCHLGESEASFCIMYTIFACTGASRLSRAAAQLQGCEDNCKMPI